jgi:Putative zinc-finger
MTRFGRVPRRPDHWSTPHDRARFRAAERIDAALDPTEASWLDEHLAGCEACLAIAEAYDTDRLALRALRDVTPEPPRDLWARTAASIEQEAGSRRSIRVGSGSTRLPLGALSGIAVIAVVLGATALSGAWTRQAPGVDSANASAAATRVAAATPMLVAAGSVGWVHAVGDGGYAYNVAALEEVCPLGDQPDCAALGDQAGQRIDLAAAPKSVIGSPTNGQAIVVGQDESGRQSVFVVSLPKARSETPPPTATPAPTPTHVAATGSPAITSAASSSTPSPSETPVLSPEVTAPVGPTAEPTQTAEPTPTTESSPIVTPVPTPPGLETASPEPTVALSLAIVSGVSVVGESAAFSADGSWFAFTARPGDGSDGPDIYVWRVGDPQARRLTTDGRSVFASWDRNDIVGSGPASDDLIDGEYQPVSFRLDPTSGERTDVSNGLWRPAVDPSGTFAVAWDGSVKGSVTGPDEMATGRGHLRIIHWPADGTASNTVGDPIPGESGPIGDFDVRWDETGSWLAIWIAEPADPAIGRLTLLRLDRGSGRLSRPEGTPTDAPALSGFSIGNGRLAWVTPNGQDAEGSKVQVVAWSGDGVGATESVPGEGVVVVR